MGLHDELINKIKNNEVVVGVLGLGYVGLPLAISFAKGGISVLGFEKSIQKVEKINSCDNYISDVDDDVLKISVQSGKFRATDDFSLIFDCDALIICVPTPLDKFKKPVMEFIENACKDIGNHMKKGVLISLESTTYPTTTETYLLPRLEEYSGMKEGVDFWLCFSPERVDPGNKDYKTENTPKVVGGLGQKATETAMLLYAKAIKSLHSVSSPTIAEMVKILENTYRLINISLINELALLCGKMEIDIWEVIEAAKTKPYGFQAFYPGPGVGGHCIPLDPFYLEYIAKKYHFDLTMIDNAGHIDNLMPHRMAIKITSALNMQKKSVSGSKILFLGVAYKPDIADERESPSLKIMDEIAEKGGAVSFHDPYIAEVKTDEGREYIGIELNKSVLAEFDCVVFSTNHSTYNVKEIVENSSLIVDLRNATQGIDDRSKIYKL